MHNGLVCRTRRRGKAWASRMNPQVIQCRRGVPPRLTRRDASSTLLRNRSEGVVIAAVLQDYGRAEKALTRGIGESTRRVDKRRPRRCVASGCSMWASAWSRPALRPAGAWDCQRPG